MKNTSVISTIACSVLLLLSGCGASKGTISLYGPESKVLGFNTYVETKKLKNCNNIVLGDNEENQDTFVIDRRWFNSTTHHVPVNLGKETNSTETSTNVTMDNLPDGHETALSACLTENGEIQLYVRSSDVKIKPLVKLENQELTCSDEIQIDSNHKSVSCKKISE